MSRRSIGIGAALAAVGLVAGLGIAQLVDRPDPGQREVVVRTVSDEDVDETTPAAEPSPTPSRSTPAASPTVSPKTATSSGRKTVTQTDPEPEPTTEPTTEPPSTGTGTVDGVKPAPLPPAPTLRRCYDPEGVEVPCA